MVYCDDDCSFIHSKYFYEGISKLVYQVIVGKVPLEYKINQINNVNTIIISLVKAVVIRDKIMQKLTYLFITHLQLQLLIQSTLILI